MTSNGVGTAPSKSEPSPTCSAPTTATACAIERAIDAGSLPPEAVGQNPIPTRPPVAAIPRRCSSLRLRSLSATARTPPCDATTGRVAIASTSSIVAAELWATSTRIRRRSSSATSSRPAPVRPIFATPCADPANALSKKWASPTIRYPAAAIRSRLARSSSRACAPSIDKRPATTPGSAVRRSRKAARSAADVTTRRPPSDRAAASRRHPARYSARARRLVQVGRGQPWTIATRRMSSVESSFRS